MKKRGRRPKVNRPVGEVLENEITHMTAQEMGRKYGVCESTIWRWLREYRESRKEVRG